jgi:hypothetical protein
MGEHRFNRRAVVEGYASTWQAHKAGACLIGCHYCVEANKYGRLTWRFIPADRYAAFRKQEEEKKEQRVERYHGNRIVPPDHGPIIQPAGRMIQPARRTG